MNNIINPNFTAPEGKEMEIITGSYGADLLDAITSTRKKRPRIERGGTGNPSPRLYASV